MKASKTAGKGLDGTRSIAPYVADRLNLGDLTSSRGVLQLIHEHGRISQAQAAEILGFSAGACSLHFQRLEYEGLIRRVEHVRGGGRGRPPVLWEVDAQRNYCISITIDGADLVLTLADFSGRIKHELRRDLQENVKRKLLLKIIDDFFAVARRQVVECKGQVRQVFAGLPGVLDQVTGKVVKSANLPVLDGLDLQAHVNSICDAPSFTGSLGLAYYSGDSSEYSPEENTLVIFWDLGVGFIFGHGEEIIGLESGRQRLPEIGHIRVVKDGRQCHCGKQGCLEAYAGGREIIEMLDRADVHSLSQLIDAIEAGDRDARRIARQAARLLGESLVWPIQLMSVDRIIINGPIARVFSHVKSAFERGLGTCFNGDEIERFGCRAISDPSTCLREGAQRMAVRLFFYPV